MTTIFSSSFATALHYDRTLLKFFQKYKLYYAATLKVYSTLATSVDSVTNRKCSDFYKFLYASSSSLFFLLPFFIIRCAKSSLMGSSIYKAKRVQSYVLVNCQFGHDDSIPNSQIQSHDAICIRKNSVIPVFGDANAECNF